MKYLYHAEKTKSLLRRWAGTSSLAMANFFFYALGTHEQKSHEGLVKALLYQILKSEPSLIPSLFPNMWQEALTSELVDLKPPSQGELKTAFSTIHNGIGKPLKFCFFIDGLDEYSGNYLHGISLLESLAANPDIKIIVSSRPIPACVQTFSDRPQLKLQELTKGDIAKYISDTISSHQYMQRMARLESDQAKSICDEVLSKASGVFLWVVLACRSLIEGFAAYDNISELRRRVDELPPELEDLFHHMLGKIEPRYQSHAAKILRICYENHLGGAERLSTIGLAILDERGLDARKASLPGQFPDTEKHGKCQVLEGRVRSRCLGLVEILRSRSELSKEHCFCNATKPEDKHDSLVDSHVTFIHRTVFDYLSQPEVWNLSCLSIDDPLFNPNATLSCIYLQLLGLSAAYKLPRRRNRTYLRHTLIHASRADSSASELIMPVLMTLEPLLRKLLVENPPYFPLREQLLKYSSDLWDSFKENFPFALLLAVESGMVNAVRSLVTLVKFPPSLSYTLLLHATCLPYSTALSPQPLDVSSEMVRYLLSSGNDPNGEFSEGQDKTKTSPWKCWLSEIDQRILKSGALETANVTMAFIQAGAEVVSVDTAETGDNLLTSMRRHFIYPHNVGNLLPEERWALRQKGLNIIGMIEDRRASKAGTNPRHPTSHPPVAGASHGAQTGPKRPTESESMEHAKRLKFT